MLHFFNTEFILGQHHNYNMTKHFAYFHSKRVARFVTEFNIFQFVNYIICYEFETNII